jgi:hypothetical protein
MARAAETYRGARRNACIRELKGVWGPSWYYSKHNAKYRRGTALSKTPSRYHPLQVIGDFLKSKGKSSPGKKVGMSAGAPRARSAGRGT